MEYDQMMQTIRREVDTKHLSYGDLAKKLGVTRQCIYNYLNGKRGNEIKAERVESYAHRHAFKAL